MATALLSPVSKKRESKMDFSYELSGYIERATDNLLLKDFKDCKKTCICGIARAKQFIEDERAQSCMEQLCVLCIQALAEMNMWEDVLPLIQDIYSNIELCPSTVIQLCILLHARVKEFSQCHALASLWLRCKDNSYKPDYDRVAALYTEHVMLPQGRLLLVPQFLNSCTHLSEDVKNKIIIHCERLNADILKESEKRDLIKEEKIVSEEPSDTDDTSEVNDDNMSLVQYMKYIGCFLAGKLAFPTYDVLWKIAVAVVTVSLLAKLVLSGKAAFPVRKLSVIWQNFMDILKAIFTPYRPGR